ncbi:MAG: 3-hydroxyacyl-CoA dehydrogenase family protein [Dehalococcoidales bacterium]|nr:3-hydroxyacyl-CoA dehydrogenase family protein [Dehalococcoidales bacterium]
MSEREIKRVAIIGAGQMGSGISVEFARYGYDVTLQDIKEEALKHAMKNIRADLDLMVETELIRDNEAAVALSKIITTLNIADAVKDADHIVEAVSENLTLKQQVFAQLDELCAPDVTLATNSSTMRVDDCAANVKHHPERILITHYWYPAPFIPLVEVIGGKRTNPLYLEKLAKVLRSMHKRVVLQKLELPTGPAGWGNALQHPIENVARKFVDDTGCDPTIVDELIRFGFGRRIPFTGIFMRYDIIGLDFFYNNAKARGGEIWQQIKERVERGETGVKSGKGFYDWPDDTAKQFARNYNIELINLMKQDIQRGDI